MNSQFLKSWNPVFLHFIIPKHLKKIKKKSGMILEKYYLSKSETQNFQKFQTSATQPLSHIATQPHSHIATQLHSYIATEPHSHIAPQPQMKAASGHLHKERASFDRSTFVELFVVTQLFGHVAMQLCSYVAIWLCGYVALWLCGHVVIFPTLAPALLSFFPLLRLMFGYCATYLVNKCH